MAFSFEIGTSWNWFGLRLAIGPFSTGVSIVRPLGLYVIVLNYVLIAPNRPPETKEQG